MMAPGRPRTSVKTLLISVAFNDKYMTNIDQQRYGESRRNRARRSGLPQPLIMNVYIVFEFELDQGIHE